GRASGETGCLTVEGSTRREGRGPPRHADPSYQAAALEDGDAARVHRRRIGVLEVGLAGCNTRTDASVQRSGRAHLLPGIEASGERAPPVRVLDVPQIRGSRTCGCGKERTAADEAYCSRRQGRFVVREDRSGRGQRAGEIRTPTVTADLPKNPKNDAFRARDRVPGRRGIGGLSRRSAHRLDVRGAKLGERDPRTAERQ